MDMVVEGVERQLLYFKRFRMEIDLAGLPPVPALPEGFSWLGWDLSVHEAHAEAKFQSFAGEIDAVVFPNLGSRQGCRNLMADIMRRPGFEPRATWLIVGPAGPCGTVQGVRERNGLGAIQNLGVVPLYRDHGLGTALLLKALHGFRSAGLGRAFLEVTAQNDGAIRLYRRLGFRSRKTLYKAVNPEHISKHYEC
jgi:ribosomal protein S18 acetylase RimI-like enzyme